MKSEFSTKTLIYLRAAELVEQGHCKNAVAQNAVGVFVDADAPDAVRWCAYGALARASVDYGGTKFNFSGYVAFTNAVGGSVVDWNNAPDTTAAMVAAKLREQAFT